MIIRSSCWYLGGVLSLLILLHISSCVHKPVQPIPVSPRDTTTVDTTSSDTLPKDTIGQDTTRYQTFKPCDPDSIYFERDLLPILISNCALSGCHDVNSAQDGVILTDYQNVMVTGEIIPFNPNNSDLFEALVEDKPEKRMPPPPKDPLPVETIELFARWINQGALQLSCEDSSICDTVNVSFQQDINPIISTFCLGCHSGSNPGAGINLSTHSNIAVVANNGRLWGAVNHENGYSAMPQGGEKLKPCELGKISAWINSGTPDN